MFGSLAVVSLICSSPLAAAADFSATLSTSSVSAKGRSEAVLTVSRYGRYAVGAESKQGTAVQIISRNEGPGPVAGIAGETNGRIDVILDRGTYKVVAWSAQTGMGQAALWVKAFREKSAPAPAILPETKIVDGSLGDLEQVSYWLPVQERRILLIEAAGRNLADLRVWKEGEWLVDAEPVREETQPVLGQPLSVARLTAAVEPGLYLVTAYGGTAAKWAKDDNSHPFHIRFGIPQVAAVGRFYAEVSAFGVDRYRVAKPTDFFRVELPEAKSLTLDVEGGNAASSFGGHGQRAEVTKKSLPPVAEVREPSGDERVITVTAPAGQPYVLQFFEQQLGASFPRHDDPREYWVSTVGSGAASDNVDATAIMTCASTVVASSVISLSASASYHRRFNLLEDASLFVEIENAGDYQVDIGGDGVKASYRFEPFLLTRPAHYVTPAYQSSGTSWSLDRGFYSLALSPSQKGIAELTVKSSSGVSGIVHKLTSIPLSRVQASAQLGVQKVPSTTQCQLHLNHQPTVTTGIVMRALPIDLVDAFSVVGPTEFPVVVREPGPIEARSDAGIRVPVLVDGKTIAGDVPVGRHVVRVQTQGSASLRMVPRGLRQESVLPPLPNLAKAQRPAFPILSARAPVFFDLASGATKTFAVRVDEPGLYRLESTGLLATRGTIRSRTVTSLASASQNGVGRNFLVAQYLREGDYQLTVAAEGASAGHLGVQLAASQVTQGGELLDGVVARAAVPAASAVVYRFHVPQTGSYALRSFGIDHTFRARFEDSAGWPLEPPNREASFHLRLAAGDYRLLVLPEPVDTLQLTQLDRAKPKAAHTGLGPHTLALGSCATHEWLEPQKGRPRVPDVWQFTLPAAAQTSVRFDAAMSGVLRKQNKDGSFSSLAAVQTEGSLQASLAAGAYTFETVSARLDNHVPYRVCVTTLELVEGERRQGEAPQSIPVSVGVAGTIELASFGAHDVRASLTDDSGQLLAKSDDRVGDWNFDIATRLVPGRYTLTVEPVGQRSADFSVEMRAPKDALQPALALPNKSTQHPSDSVLVFPLTGLPSDTELLVVQATANEAVGLSIETQFAGAWVSSGVDLGRRVHLEVPVTAHTLARVRLWSIDHRAMPVTLQAVALAVHVRSESALAAESDGQRVEGVDPPLSVAAFTIDHPSVFAVASPEDRWTSSTAVSATRAADGVVAAQLGRLYAVSERAGASFQGTRVVLDSSAPVSVDVPERGSVGCDLAKSIGPRVVIARSRVGQPGLKLQTREGASAAVTSGMAVTTNGALAVSLRAAETQAIVWPASRVSEPLDVALTTVSYAKPNTVALSFGASEHMVEGALAFALPHGDKQIHLVADPDMVAVLSQDETVMSTHWAGAARLDETFNSSATRLTLLSLSKGPRGASVELVAAAPELFTMTDRVPWLNHFATSGTARITMAGGRGARAVHIRGGASAPWLIGADGSVSRGDSLVVPAEGGVLFLPHLVGWTAAWSETSAGNGLWPASQGPTVKSVSESTRIALDAAQARVRLEAKTPTVFHLRADTPAISQVTRQREAPIVTLDDSALALDVLVEGTAIDVTLASLTRAPFGSTLEITTSALIPLHEGVGPALVLGSGQSRIYAFTVIHESAVGIGVRSDADALQVTLSDVRGQSLGGGTAQMPTLKPGRYLLTVHLARDAAAASVQPSVVGLVTPDSSPPEAVKRAYYAGDAEPVAFFARHSSEGGGGDYRFGTGSSDEGETADGSAARERSEDATSASDGEAGSEGNRSEGQTNEGD